MTARKKYTISDIARELNTTSSTISRALQDSPRISLKMRQAAQALAKEHNYEPDFRASNLRKGTGKTIGVMVPNLARHFFSTVLSGVDEVASQAGYSVLICQSFESYEKEQLLLKNLMNGRVDGLIVSISIETRKVKHFEQFMARGLPLVFFDRVPEAVKTSKVLVNDYLGACKATEHLIENGARHIAHFSGPQDINVYRERTRGFIDTMAKHGLEIDDTIVFTDAITREAGAEAMQQLIDRKKLPDALFSSGDYSALGAVLCARKNQIRIPDDMLITGFANEPWDSFFDPPLTSVDQHAHEVGKQAARILLQQIESGGDSFVPRNIVLEPELIIRESSVPKKISDMI